MPCGYFDNIYPAIFFIITAPILITTTEIVFVDTIFIALFTKTVGMIIEIFTDGSQSVEIISPNCQ
jgi:hypothetical protein